MQVPENQHLTVCQKVAKLGGEQLMKFRESFKTSSKGKNDLVTDADFASQQAIHDSLLEHFPDHCFLGEEKLDLGMMQNFNSDYRWIVDPLDGTLNYVHGLQSFSVSVALEHKGILIAAAVYDPWMDELYSASDTTPSTLNGEPIRTSNCQDLEKALGVISLPASLDSSSPELKDFLSLLYRARSVRRLGSAALNFCYVAAGRLDFYWATTVKSWDVAAGYLILKQAHGITTDLSGSAMDLNSPKFVAAASHNLNDEIRGVLDT